MAGARVPGAAHRLDRLQGTAAASGRESRPGHHPERRGSPYLSTARQTRASGHRPQPAGLGLPPRRSQIRVTASISRRLIFWLAVPLMLLALCGALVHYFNSIAPGVISSDRRLKEGAAAVMAQVKIRDGRLLLDEAADTTHHPPSADSVIYAVRDAQGRLLAGDARLPMVPMSGE